VSVGVEPLNVVPRFTPPRLKERFSRLMRELACRGPEEAVAGLEYGKTDGKNDPDGGAPSPHPVRTFLSHIGYRSSAHETAIAIATGTKSPASAVHIPAFEFDRRSSP
jgi:hypothetical protein